MASTGKTLNIKDCVWVVVFRAIVAHLEQDREFARVVGKDRMASWKGVPGDQTPDVPSLGKPIVRLTPMPGDVQWFTPDSQSGMLSVLVELDVATMCVDDVANLWNLISDALQPGTMSGAVKFSQVLVLSGAETGEILFNNPGFRVVAGKDTEGYFSAEGTFQLRIILPILE